MRSMYSTTPADWAGSIFEKARDPIYFQMKPDAKVYS